ncbi:MAG: tetratricopeptide repeat protein, partial [Elusimicrobia bacterium]|nr:tetratricopeptide repeat protein [Elusimicrobiota bacterium]
HTMRTHANNSHNEILEIFSQTGLLGLGAFLWIWAAFFLTARRWAKDKVGDDPVWIASVAGVAAVLVDNLLNVSLHFAVPAFLFWWLAGTAMGRGAKAAAPRVWSTRPRLRMAAGSALVAAALSASWWQVRIWYRETWYFAGFKLIRQGNMPAAAHALERSRAWGPREVNAIYELGNVYARSGRPAEAADAYAGAMRANAGYDEIYFNLATVYAAHMGNLAKARGFYETAWALNPLSNETVNGLSTLYLRDPGKYKALAADLLAEAARIFPGNANHWNNLGYVLTLDRRWNEAVNAYSRALELSPESEMIERNLVAVVAQGRLARPPILEDLEELRSVDAAVSRGDWSARSLQRCARLSEKRPTLLKARFLHGSLLLANNRPLEAAAELERVVAIDPSRSAARVNLGNAYLALGRRPDAEAQFRATLALEPSNAAARGRLAAMGRPF